MNAFPNTQKGEINYSWGAFDPRSAQFTNSIVKTTSKKFLKNFFSITSFQKHTAVVERYFIYQASERKD